VAGFLDCLSSNYNFLLIPSFLIGDAFIGSLGIEIPFLFLRLLLGVRAFLPLAFLVSASAGLSV
jgi:hypothetical protein